MTERFVVGLVGAPFGLQGFVKVRSLSGEYEHLQRLTQVVLRQGDEEKTWEVEASALVHEALVMKFKGIDTPEGAKTLTGAELVSDRAHAAPLQSDEFYVEDLRGLEVVGLFAEEGEVVLGCINNVIEGGGGSLVEIRLPSGELKLVPFRNEFFGDISLERGRAVLREPWVLA
ncbi:MAG: ribosome maturation factor RimM [Treponema sp.]|jgi:16S rRNA processing protein RimM|nr:ribosome maturation factor RimM [Treponema sp.]